MDKKDRIIELKVKIIELTLEKKKDLFKTLISFIFSVLSFAYTINFIKEPNSFFVKITSTIIIELLKLPEYINLIAVFSFPFIVAYLTYSFSTRVMNSILEEQKKIYTDAIEGIEILIRELEPTAKLKQNRGKKRV